MSDITKTQLNMKRLLLYVAIVLSLSVVSCTKEGFVDRGPELVVYDSLDVYVTAGGMTIGASVKDMTEITATFYGEVAKDSLQMTAKSYGFLYTSAEEDSLTVKNSTKIVVKKLDENNCFESIEGKLTPGAAYIWTVFVENEGEYTLGEVREFQTLELVAPEVKEVTVTYESATFDGMVTLLQAETRKVEFGVLYSESRTDLRKYEGEEFVIDEDMISKRGKFSATLGGLKEKTTYYYVPYVSVSKSVAYGEIEDFTTAALPVYGTDVAGIDLSGAAKAPANCYIVSASGQYKFPAMKGNGGEYVKGGASAEVLWESYGTSTTPNVGSLISKAEFKDNYVAFEVPDGYSAGNAVIAVKNATGTVLWSWHIWLPADKIEEQEYYNGAGVMMDRNLGATSAVPGSVGALGLFYQWGRKDPFLGSSSINEAVMAISTADWPAPVLTGAEVGSVQYAVCNPMTFIKAESGSYDWSYVRTDNLWQSKKTVYDPCPSGWRVPDGGENGVWTKALALENSDYFEVSFDDADHGAGMSGRFGDSATIWYPAHHSRSSNSGELSYEVGCFGVYWSCTPKGGDACEMGFDDGGTGWMDHSGRATAASVRCVKE